MTGIKKSTNNNYVLISMISVFFSSFIINLLIKKGITFDYLYFSFNDFEKTMKLPVVSSFLLILFKRLKQIIVVLILMKFFNREKIFEFIIFFFSVLYGVFLSVQSYYGGIGSVGVLLISIFPHYIVYFLCVDLCFKFFNGKVLNNNKSKFVISEMLLVSFGTFLETYFLRFF